MVNNQEWFDKKYSKEEKKIELRREKFEGQLVVEDYLKLENLSLRDIRNVDKVVLRNLGRLQECTIWDCKIQDLVIENCPELRILNVRKNLLTNLEFLANLEKLEKLELNGNPELIEILKPYNGNWEACRIVELAKQNPQKLLKTISDLREENKKLKNSSQLIISEGVSQQRYDNLKNFLKEVMFSLSQEAKQELVNKLEKETKRGDNLSTSGRTQELIFYAKEVVESAKELKKELESELTKSKTEIQGLEEKLKEKQEEISYLNSQLQEQGKKILNAYQYCVSEKEEKELLDKLIKEHIEFTKFKEQESVSYDYDEKIEEYEEREKEIKKQLREKLKKEKMNEIRRILTECEKIAKQQLGLEANLSDEILLIEDKKQILLQMPNNEEKEQKIRQLELELAKAKVELGAKKDENSRLWERLDKPTNVYNIVQNIYQIQYNNIQQQLKDELGELKQRYQILDSTNEPTSDPQKLKKTILFLGAKKTFAETRQNTISNLVDIYEKTTNGSGKKFDKVKEVGDTINDAGWMFPGAEAVVKAVGKGISTSAKFFKKNFLAEQMQEFKDYLIGDEKALELLKETHQSLENSFQNNQNKLSTIASILKLDQNRLHQLDQHSVFKVGDLKEEEILTVDKMSQTVEDLTKHLEEFIQELQQEADQCDREMKNLFAEKGGKLLQQEFEKLLNELGDKNEQVFSQQAQIIQTTNLPYGTSGSSK